MVKYRSVNRRRFLGLGALVASVVGVEGLFGQVNIADASIMRPGEFDQTFLSRKADIRQIWDFTTADQARSGIGAIKNAMNAFQFSYQKSHYVVIDLRGPSAVIYGLDDTMWVKYGLAAKYQILDEEAGAFANHNTLYKRLNVDNGTFNPDDGKSLFQDATLQAFQQRGAHIAICHDALQAQASLAVKDRRAHRLTADQVYKDMAAHLVPGAQQTPSGSALIAVAQAIGFTYAKQ